MAPYVRTSIDSGWQFKQVGVLGVPEWNHDFLPVAQFPTNVHLDLMAHNMIPDPFLGLNEFKIQWVGEQKWLYRTNFVAHHQVSAPKGAKLVLQFEGLDTFANVVLNGVQILTTDNMHRTFRVDVSDNVRCGENELEILFDSAIIRGMELMEETSFRPAAFTKATDKSRMLVRKAQYHYSWNWGMHSYCPVVCCQIILKSYFTNLMKVLKS
jgi:beta-mannosidase